MTTTARFHGPQGGVKSGRAGERGRGRNKGALATYREVQRDNAEARNKLTKPSRRRVARCPDECGHVDPASHVLDLTGGEVLPGGALLVTDPKAVKMLTEIFTAPELKLNDPPKDNGNHRERVRRRRNIERKRKAHTGE
jgi:hypothetical protein